jgi:hypothetical protein
MKSFLLASALTLTATAAIGACDKDAAYGLKGVNVGKSATEAQIVALFTEVKPAHRCSDDPTAMCRFGKATIAGRPVSLNLTIRDGRVEQIGATFDPSDFLVIENALSEKYCPYAESGTRLDRPLANRHWTNARGDRIALMQSDGASPAVLSIDSAAQAAIDDAAIKKAQGDI